MPARLQLADDFLHALQLVAMRDQHRVGRVDDDEVLDADRRDHAVLGMDERAARVDRRRARRWPRLPSRVGVASSSEIACHEPTSLQSNVAAHDGHGAVAGGLLHHRVVDRNVGHRGEQSRRRSPASACRRLRVDARCHDGARAARAPAGAWRSNAARIARGVKQNMPEFHK